MAGCPCHTNGTSEKKPKWKRLWVINSYEQAWGSDSGRSIPGGGGWWGGAAVGSVQNIWSFGSSVQMFAQHHHCTREVQNQCSHTKTTKHPKRGWNDTGRTGGDRESHETSSLAQFSLRPKRTHIESLPTATAWFHRGSPVILLTVSWSRTVAATDVWWSKGSPFLSRRPLKSYHQPTYKVLSMNNLILIIIIFVYTAQRINPQKVKCRIEIGLF